MKLLRKIGESLRGSRFLQSLAIVLLLAATLATLLATAELSNRTEPVGPGALDPSKLYEAPCGAGKNVSGNWYDFIGNVFHLGK